MVTVLIRAILIYVFLIFIMKLMGKRQLGELEVTDLVITLLLSEIATIPITDKNTPLLHALIPVVTLACLEIFTSALALRFPKFKSLLSPKQAILIQNGKINRKEMKKVRISLDELLCELRQHNVTDPSEVQYAILESNGKLSILTKAANTPPTAQLLGIQPTEHGMMHIIYCDGVFSSATLRSLGKDQIWATKMMQQQGYAPDQVFYMMVDDADNVLIQRREK